MTHIVNLSLKSGSFPDAPKTAIVRPLLKKHNLDKNDLKNFRPVSNIAFVSKLIEKVVVKRLSDYMSKNQLNETFQSAYRQHHGTETALVKVLDDILRSLDNKCGIILVMLDLSAAFDTIDHDILLDRFRIRLGLGGSAIKLLREYHTHRMQTTVINSARSKPRSLDDSDNYISFKLDQKSHFENAVSKVTQRTTDIKAWMTKNKLKLNDTKTEVLVIVPQLLQ